MKKLLKGLCALLLAASCVTSLPVMDVEAATVGNPIYENALNRKDWTVHAYNYDAANNRLYQQESVNKGNDGPATNMIDDSRDTLWHTCYSEEEGSAYRQMPIYVVIQFSDDLSKMVEFDTLTWENRTNNPAESFELYISTSTEETLLPGDEGFDEFWTLKKSATFKSNLINELYVGDLQATQIMMKVSNGTSFMTCEDFNLYNLGTFDRTNWEVSAYNFKNLQDSQPGNESEGNPNYLIDGKNNTWWHSQWNEGFATNVAPYYIIVDLDKNGEGSLAFEAFSWTNRGHNQNDGANGVVENFRFYVTDDNSLELPLKTIGTASDDTINATVSGHVINDGWRDVTNKIEGFKTDESGKNYATMKYLASPAEIYENYFDFTEEITAKQVMIEVLTTRNASSDRVFGSGIEFNLYKDTVNKTLLRTDWTISAGITKTDERSEYSSQPASTMLDGNLDTKWHSDWSNRTDGYGEFYVKIKLGALKQFNSFSWIGAAGSGGEAANGDIQKYKFYALVSDDLDKDYNCNDEAWGTPLVVDAQVAEGGDVLNKYVGEVSATHIMVKMVGKADNAGHHGTCAEFYLYNEKGLSGELDYVYSETEVEDDDKLFESHYGDKTVANPLKNSTETSFMRYITRDVLDVKYQSGTAVNGKLDARFVATVPSLNLEQVGFILTVNGKTKYVGTTTVYTSLNSLENGVAIVNDPQWTYNNASSNYFFAVTLRGIPATIDDSITDQNITVQAFWVPNGGTPIELDENGTATELGNATILTGEPRTITLEQILLNSPNVSGN